MNMRVRKPVVVASASYRPRSGAGLRRVVQASVVPIAAGVSALAFDTFGYAPPTGAGRLSGEIAGRELPRPIISTRLPLRRGGLRHVLLIGQDAERLAASPCRLALDGVEVAALDPSWLQSPLAATFDLIDGLSDEGRRRLLRMFLTTAASLYGAGRAGGYGAAVRRLVALLGAPELSPASVCALGAGGRILTFRTPAGAPLPELQTLIALSDDRVSRVPDFSATVEPHARGALLHVFLPGDPGDRLLVGLAPDPLVLGCLGEVAPQPLAPWLSRRAEATRDWAEGLTFGLAATDASAGALLRELRHIAAPPPELVLRHLSAAPQGVLLLADLVDPHQLVAALRIETDAGAQDLPVHACGPGRATIGGFLRTERPVRPGACGLRLVYGSGRVRKLRNVPLAAYTGGVPEGFADLDAADAAAALAAARVGPRRRALPGTVETIGAQPARPKLSLVLAVGANPDVLRARAAQLFVEPGHGAVELVYHVGAAQAGAARRALAYCDAVFGLGCRLVVLPDATDASERLLAALDAARAPAVLSLGGDVLPAATGWLADWTTALKGGRRPALLGGTLVSPDGAVRDAGGTLRRDGDAGPALIDRRWVGLPARDLPRASAAATELVTVDCLGLNRAAVAALRTFETHDPDPDVLLIALAHRLRRGAASTLLKARFIRFGEATAADPLAEAVAAHALAALLRPVGGEGGM